MIRRVGGTPQYLRQIDDKMSVAENIKNTFLNPASALFEEPENLLKQELREPALYNAILTAIAAGASRMSEIAGKVGVETNVCSVYVKTLAALLGECKWTNEKVDLGVLETLLKRSELFPQTHKYFYLFAKSGFTKGCADRAREMGNVALVRYGEMVRT